MTCAVTAIARSEHKYLVYGKGGKVERLIEKVYTFGLGAVLSSRMGLVGIKYCGLYSWNYLEVALSIEMYSWKNTAKTVFFFMKLYSYNFTWNTNLLHSSPQVNIIS